MVGRLGGGERARVTAAAPPRDPWEPLRYPVYRALWFAAIGSNIGTWMHTVAASWLMATLTTSPLPVALVQTASSLPVFLLGLFAGALADMVERRRLLLVTQSLMLTTAAALAAVAWFGYATPARLLALTFALGVCTALNGPAWTAAVPETVPRPVLPTAVALNSVGFNIARATGPALGGFLVAATQPAVGFLLNSLSYAGVIAVLARWRPEPDPAAERPESFRDALAGGVRYFRTAPEFRHVLYRSGLFGLASSAMWALLPVVAKAEFGSAAGYGVLLGCLGAGSVAGATVMPRLRDRYQPDGVAVRGAWAIAIMIAGLALSRYFAVSCLAMLWAGFAWLNVMSQFNVAAQATPPAPLRARALAMYLLVFQGSLAAGSGLWGAVASRWGVSVALLAAAGVLAVSASWAKYAWPLPKE